MEILNDQTPPKKMHEPGAGYNGCDIEQNPGAVSKKAGDIAKDDLTHGIVGTDVEHVDPPVRIEQEIEQCRSQAAGKKEADTFPPSCP